MIELKNVHKRYRTAHGSGPWVLAGVNLRIPRTARVGLIGRNGAGKSTLLRLIAGIDQPTHGQVHRQCRVSWPVGFGGGIQGSLTGRQNARFVLRLHGMGDQLTSRLQDINEFAELGDAFDEPVSTYSSGMRSRLQFALSLAFDFDVYISDEVTATGDAAFQKKAANAFSALTDRAGLVMVSHGESTLRRFCRHGIWLHEGRALWFDSIEEALQQYKGSVLA